MDEQIKPVAWIMPSAMKALSAEGSAMVGVVDQGIDLPLYSQQAIDALRAEVQWAMAAVESKAGWEWRKRAERAEAEAEALREELDAERARVEWFAWSGGQIVCRDHDYAFIDSHDGRTDYFPTAREAIDAARKGAE